MNTTSLSGQIDLLALAGAHMENGSIVIPTNNPSVFVCRTKNGAEKAYLDIVIRESPNNQYGNTHFVKANVGKSNRERFGISREDAVRAALNIPANFRIRALLPTGYPAESSVPSDRHLSYRPMDDMVEFV